MRVHVEFPAVLASLGLLLAPSSVLGQEEIARPVSSDMDALIASALSAAPDEIAAGATVRDPDGNVLREGSNEFTCFPDDPEIPGNAPFCADAGWMALIGAWMNREDPPALETPAFIYALQGGWPASNVDPFADGPTEDNEWIGPPGPHVAVLLPGDSPYAGIGTDHEGEGPWVMWRETPYAHLMIPAAKKE